MFQILQYIIGEVFINVISSAIVNIFKSFSTRFIMMLKLGMLLHSKT